MAIGICRQTFRLSQRANLILSLRLNRQFYQASTVSGWVVVVFERQNRFNTREVQSMIQGLTSACKQVGTCYLASLEVYSVTNLQ